MKQSLYAPHDQQREGLKFVLQNTTLLQLRRSLEVLVERDFMSRSQRDRIIKEAQDIIEKEFVTK